MNEPLAERVRPKKLSDEVSQTHLVGKHGALTQHIKQGLIPSMIFWGPPGIGKTTLANIIANESGRPFYTLKIGRDTSELQSRENLVCRLLLEKKKNACIDYTV